MARVLDIPVPASEEAAVALGWGDDLPVLTESLRLHHDGKIDQALALYLWLDARHAGNSDLKFNIGECYRQRRHLSQAVRALRAALAIDPELIAAHESLGEVLREQQRLPESEASFRRILELDANHLGAFGQLASVLKAQMRYDEAMAVIGEALEKKPDFTDALLLLGTLYYEKGDIETAVTLFRRSVALEPQWPQAHFNLSQCLLLQGIFPEGWREYEWRDRTSALMAQVRDFAAPRWSGEPLCGKTLLLFSEQGLGDTLQYARYIPLLMSAGATVILECQPQLVRLMAHMTKADRVIVRGETLPPCDFQTSLMRLPHVMGTNLATIPPSPGFHSTGDAWGPTLSARGLAPQLPRIGVCWAGNPEHSNDTNRSLSLGLLEPVLQRCMNRVTLVSLQCGPRAMERYSYRWADGFFDAAVVIEDFADTAEIIDQLDLVISVDTAVLHLAGVMGGPVWGLLPFVPDSRWLMGRTDSPWYPSMRLFRQSEQGDWGAVLIKMEEQLQKWLSGEGAMAAGKRKQERH